MAVSSRAAEVGQKELKTDWPVTEGITAGTTKQKSTSPILEPQSSLGVKSTVRSIETAGIR